MNNTKKTIFSILDTDVICMHKTDILPSYPEITFHNHDGYEIYLFLNGNADYYTEKTGKHLERGDLILISPYSFHYIDSKPHETYERIIINLKENYMSDLCKEKNPLSDCFHKVPQNLNNLIHLNSSEIDQFMNLTSELENNITQQAFGRDLMIHSLVTQLLIMINRKTLADEFALPTANVMPPMIKKTIFYINEHLTETIRMDALSKYIHHNSDYINRCFKSVTGISVQQYILAKKLTFAQKCLREGVPPCDACHMAGFNNYANFSRTFSNHTGLSPKQYQIKQRTVEK